jgi:hypothetical protein
LNAAAAQEVANAAAREKAAGFGKIHSFLYGQLNADAQQLCFDWDQAGPSGAV